MLGTLKMNILLILLSIGLVACAGIRNRYHEIVPGDTFAKLANRYEVPLKALRNYNPGLRPTQLKIGAKLYIPFEQNPRWDDEEGCRSKRDARASHACCAAERTGSRSTRHY